MSDTASAEDFSREDLIQLAGIEEDKVVVNDDNLYKLLKREDVQGRPLVVIPIAGAFRSGKSFMMNFFIRYLRNKGWQNNSNWFDLGNETMKPGRIRKMAIATKDKAKSVTRNVVNFIWNRGPEACTHGILVCPEVFQMPLENGRMAAVLLVDTQGLFDSKSSDDTNAKILSLSLLFSSHQILNVMRQIESRDWTHVKLCIEYTKSVAEISGDDNFQNLTVLVRDYEHGNLGDGRDYLQQSLNKESSAEEVVEVKAGVKNAFDDIGCFLLPQPKKKVRVHDGLDLLQNEHLGEEFRKYVKQFVELVLDPKQVRIKRLGGKEVQADDLLNVIGRVGQAYKEGKAPIPETFQQSIVRGNNTKALIAAVSKYQERMDEVCRDIIRLSDEELESAHNKALEEANKRFHDVANIGREESKKEFLTQCKKECEVIFDKWKQKRRAEKKMKLSEFQCLKRELEAKYRHEMISVAIDSSMKILETAHTEYKGNCIGAFDVRTRDFGKFLPEVENMKKNLLKEIQDTYTDLKEYQLNHIQKRIAKDPRVKVFEDKIKEKSENFDENIQDQLEKFKKMTLRELNNSEDGRDAEYGSELEHKLDSLIKEAIESNDYRKKLCEATCEIHGRKCGEDFEKIVSKIMKDAYIHEATLDAWIMEFWEDQKTPEIGPNPSWARRKIEEEFRNKAETIGQQNQDNKKYRSVTINELSFWGRFVKIFWGSKFHKYKNA